MARYKVPPFAAPGSGVQSGSLVRFYSDSGATTPVTVYDSAGNSVSSVHADPAGQVSALLYVDSSVASLYARTENLGTANSTVLHLLDPASVDPAGAQSGTSGAAALIPTAVKTAASYTAVVGDLVPVDTTSNAVTVTLPTAPADKAQVAVKLINQGQTANGVTIARGGSDVFNKAGGSTSLTLTATNQLIHLQYASAAGIWYVLADSLSRTTVTPNALPYYAAPRSGLYDARWTLYNWKPSNTRWWRQQSGAALAGSGAFNVLFLGDSKTAGYSAGGQPSSWPQRICDFIAARGYPVGGSGMTFPGSSQTCSDSRWVFGANWTSLGLHGSYNLTNANPATFTSTKAGTVVTVWYRGNGGVFTVTVDGVSPSTGVTATNGAYSSGTVTPSGAAAWGSLTITGLANTTHAVAFVRVSGTPTIMGCSVGGTTGMFFHNAGASGAKASDFADFTYPNGPGGAAKAAVPLPNVIFLSLSGINEITGSVSTATYKTNMQTIITTWKAVATNPDIILVAETCGKPLSSYAPYLAAMYDLADTNDLPLFDLADRFGDQSVAAALGQLLGDQLHDSAAGHAAIAADIAPQLA